MKVLVLGPSGSGKTYLAAACKSAGLPAFDADDVTGLSRWYDGRGKQVAAPATAAEAVQNQYSFLWSRRFLNAFLAGSEDLYLLGGSGNVFDVVDLFDKAYFLQISPALQEERLRSSDRKNPLMDLDKERIFVWGSWLEEEAKKRQIPFIDASLPPEKILQIIQQP
jgi:hypothetical protein